MEIEKIVGESFNAHDFAQKKAREMAEKLKPKEEEEVEEPVEEQEEATEEEEAIDEPVEEEEKQEEVVEGTEKERALLREIARLKSDRREEKQKLELSEITPTSSEEESIDVSKAEALVYSAWRNEALEEFVDKHPEYTTNLKAKERFETEYAERLPELVYAKRHNIPVTKKFFKDRFDRIHKAVSDSTISAKESGKKELLKAQSAASVMAAGSGKSEGQDGKPKPAKKNILLQKSGGLNSWLSKKT